jgi:DNA (cytosine-5)-methyltransferase 1
MGTSARLAAKKGQTSLQLGDRFEDHQSWLSWLHDTLPKPNLAPDAPIVIDLFAGCGGLALGFEAQGFRTVGFEMKPVAVQTYNANLDGRCEETLLTVGIPEGKADIIIGGPPCQPFSQIGYQRGNRDPRDGFPVFLDAVRRIQPKIAIIENVRGLLFRNKDYLRKAAREFEQLGYTVHVNLLKANEYGVPQNRERVVVVASKVGWSWPEPLLSEPVTVATALGPLADEFASDSRFLTPSMDRYIAAYEQKSFCIRPRDLHLDQPSRTVTCRNLGGATSDMLRLRLADGRRRMLTVREGARLQGFPDWFEFRGDQYEQFEQIGNAVPPLLAVALARQVKAIMQNPATLSIVKPMARGLTGKQKPGVLDNDSRKEKLEQAENIMKAVGIPVRGMTPRRAERVALALLAVAQLKPKDNWSKAQCYFDGSGRALTTRQIIRFWNEHYGQDVADSSYDDVRRKDLIVLVECGLVARSAADPSADVNDGTRGYSIHESAISLLRSYGTKDWEPQLIRFRGNIGSPDDRLSKARDFKRVPVVLPDGKEFKLSPGPHNLIQKAVIEEFIPRFSRGCQVLYLGDTEKKILFIDEPALEKLGIPKPSRAMLPDILAYEPERNWLFVIEAVHSSNPIGILRHKKLQELTENCSAGRIYVSAFENAKAFRKFVGDISWQTEVWILDNPDHIIHFDGARFLGPYETVSE